METQTPIVHQIKVELIDRPAIPDRLSIDSEHIRDLASSISQIGLQQPILLRPNGLRYEIVYGDCRFQAVKTLGWDLIPAFIKELDDETISLERGIENLQRRDLTPIEEARIYKNLHDNHNLSWDDISKKTGKSVSVVKRRYDLLKMPEILIAAIHEKKVSTTVAEELCDLHDVGRIEYYLGYCIDHGATREVVRQWVKDEKMAERQPENAGGGGDWGSALPECKPVYVSCDLCSGPMELSEVVSLRICKTCHHTIKQNM